MPSLGCALVAWVVLEGGTLTSSAGSLVLPLVRRSLAVVGNGVGSGGSVVGTLLGPEGTGPSFVFAVCGGGGGLVGLVRGRSASHTAASPEGGAGLVGSGGR